MAAEEVNNEGIVIIVSHRIYADKKEKQEDLPLGLPEVLTWKDRMGWLEEWDIFQWDYRGPAIIVNNKVKNMTWKCVAQDG